LGVALCAREERVDFDVVAPLSPISGIYISDNRLAARFNIYLADRNSLSALPAPAIVELTELCESRRALDAVPQI
jgi:hypothetical protein